MNRMPTLTLTVSLLAPLAGFGCCLQRLVSSRFVVCLIAAVAIQTAAGGEPEKTFLDFIRIRSAELRARDEAPASLGDWQRLRSAIRG